MSRLDLDYLDLDYLDLDYVDGPDVQALVAKLYAMPQHIIDRAQQATAFKP